MDEFKKHEQRKRGVTKKTGVLSVEELMLMFCLREDDLLVSPQEYLSKLFSAETLEDLEQLRVMEKSIKPTLKLLH